MLVGSVIGGSSIGVVANYITPTNTFVKAGWRNGLNTVFFLVPSIIEYRYYRVNKSFDISKVFSFKYYLFLLLTLSMNVLWTSGLIYASTKTI